MTATRLDVPFLDGGLRSTHFFNGRILSREDMQREQDAARAIYERLGLSIGDGIVRGFEVAISEGTGGSSVTSPAVTVRAGLAINREGKTIALDRDVDVALLKPTASSTTATTVSGFGVCAPPDESVYVTGSGVYLLSVAPAQARQGLALVSGLANGGASCNAKELVEGLQFRLFRLKSLSNTELLPENARWLRNVAAYKFFLAEGAATDAARDPFGSPTSASLTEPVLTDCDVPLAILHWTALGGLRWVDLWSVRRRVAGVPLPGFIRGALDAKRDALAEALRAQFQEHIQTLRTTSPLLEHASEAFRWLPPIGLLPLGGIPGALGFDELKFFAGFTTRKPMYIEGARLPALLRLSGSYPPISVGDPELVWLYHVRENQQPQNGVVPTQPYLVFALGRVPCQVAPRFDVSHWDYANYALDNDLTGW